MKKLIIAKSAGFCFGVERSIEMAERLLQEKGKAFSCGELVHNADVVKNLQGKGLTLLDDKHQLQKGDAVIIRAHGVSKAVVQNMENAGARITDATCPKVKSIHKIVSNAADAQRFVIIIGMRNHPEVEAICGWCDNCFVAENYEELKHWLSEDISRKDFPITLVSQTTQTRTNYEQCADFIKKICTNVQLFDTICNATFTRQNEAIELSKQCDAMIVIGGRHSANSIHLAEVCRENCSNVQFIERAFELDLSRLQNCEIVGLTAGASTPEWIIKEVRNKMSDEIKVAETAPEEMSFDEMLEDSLKPIYNGEKVTGIVAGISGTEVSVDLGTKYSGFIPTTEFTDNGIKIEDAVKVGDTIEAIVVRVNDVEGTAQLSKKRLDATKFWEEIENAVDSEAVLEGVVTEENKGGVVVNVKGTRVFVPASQTDLPRDAELAQLLKKTVKLRITEVNKARKRVVGSIRRAAQADRHALAEKVWNEIEVGKKYAGIVKSLTNYGAFVDIGGVDGMVHVTELGWGRIHAPADVVKVGDPVNVYVISFDKDAHRISLGCKDPDENPWKKFMDAYKVGDVVSATVVKLMPFGAFAEVLPGVDGLIHISQIANHRIAKPEDVLKVGDVVDVKITAIDEEKQKISLSIRALLEPETEAEESAAETEPTGEPEA